jgi:ribosomal protein S18 acetylase RimI-like enzyme
MTPDDRPSVIELFKEFVRHEAGLDPHVTPFVQDRTNDPDEAEAYLRYGENLVSEHDGAHVVADEDGRVVGFLCLTFSKEGPFIRPELRTVGEVSFVIVSRKHRGLGIGRDLMKKAEQLTMDAGLQRLSLMVMAGNVGAVEMYEHIGFRTRAYKMLKKL